MRCENFIICFFLCWATQSHAVYINVLHFMLALVFCFMLFRMIIEFSLVCCITLYAGDWSELCVYWCSHARPGDFRYPRHIY